VRTLSNWLIRGLSICHFAWGTILLLLAAWIIISAFHVLSYMSSGAFPTRLLTAMILALSHAAPFGLLGLWMVSLGRRTWKGHVRLRKALIVTHGLLLPPGLLAVILGFYGMRAAERSVSQGGGLLSPYAVVPLLIGVPLVLLALLAIASALTIVPKQGTSP